MSHFVCANPWEVASASAAATSVLISMISSSEGRAAKFVRPPVRASIAEKLEYRVSDRERRGEARRLDAEQIDEARDAVVGRPLDEEIARGLAAPLELGPDSGIRGLQGAVLVARPVAAYGLVKNLRALRIDYDVDPERGEVFYEAIRSYWPGLEDGALQPAYSGIRPKLQGRGEASRDFLIQGPTDHGVAGLVNLFGIESPGLTASLAIGDAVLELLGD